MISSRRVGLISLVALSLVLGQGAWCCVSAEPAVNSDKKPRTPVCDRAAFRVAVDVGHTAESPGAPSARGFWEYDFNLRLATAIKKGLIDAGFGKTILLVTDGPTRRGLVNRVTRANNSSADLFLSIHHDSVPDSFLQVWQYEGQDRHFSDRFKGHSIFISNDNPDVEGSLAFGRLLGEQLKARGLQYTPHYTQSFMGHRQRLLVDAKVGVYRYDQLIVLRTTQMPAVLLEAGSIINRDEELVMNSPERRSLISAAVTDAVESFCAARKPRNLDRVARPAGAAAKQTLPYEGATSAANPAKPR
jgi:N-acetylmuramoyl-L-alanine amidase